MLVKELLANNKQEIITQYELGVSTCELGRRFNTSNASIYRFLRDVCKVEIRQTKKDSNTPQIVELFECGISLYEIANKLNMNMSTVHRLAKKAGLETSKNCKIREDQLNNHIDEIIKLYLGGMGCTKLSQKYDCSESSIGRLLKENGIETGQYSRKYEFDERYFEKIDNEHKAYIAGFIQGDGSNSGNNLRISIADEDLLMDIRKSMRLEHLPIKVIKPRKSHHKIQYLLKVCSTAMSKDLDRLGLVKNKTFKTFLPREDQVPDNLIHHFLRGLLDADGSITNGQVNYVGYKDLMTDIKIYLEKILQIHVWIGRNNIKYNQTILKLIISNYADQIKLLDFLYQDATLFLKRKHDRYLQLKQNGRDVCFSSSS